MKWLPRTKFSKQRIGITYNLKLTRITHYVFGGDSTWKWIRGGDGVWWWWWWGLHGITLTFSYPSHNGWTKEEKCHNFEFVLSSSCSFVTRGIIGTDNLALISVHKLELWIGITTKEIVEISYVLHSSVLWFNWDCMKQILEACPFIVEHQQSLCYFKENHSKLVKLQ